MEFGVHLPLIDFAGEGLSFDRLATTVDAARICGFSSVSVNDHFLFAAPWLDGLTALAAIVERSGSMQLATAVSLPTLRGPVPLAKALVALDLLSGGRLIAGIGPGSSRLDYEALGVPFEDRWRHFDEALRQLSGLLRSGTTSEGGTCYPLPPAGLAPLPHRRAGIPLWIGSWGSPPGMRRVARLGDGWLASAYNTTPEEFAANRTSLCAELEKQGRAPDSCSNALVTMWAWVTDDDADAERVLSDVLGPLVKREPRELRDRSCIGPPRRCAELLSRYARAGCQEVFFWTVGDERRQVELLASEVIPRIVA